MSTVHPETKGSSVGSDLRASVVVFLVALPLCMGVAIASGVPVAAGLLTGIVGGIVTGTIAGCPLQVSGPAAGLTVIIFEIVQRFGLQNLGLVVFVAGVLQVVAGVFRLGQWFRAVSPAVIRGMLAGIGFLILGSQFHVMLDGKPPGNGAKNLSQIPAAIRHAWQPVRLADASTRRNQVNELRSVKKLQSAVTALQQALPQAVKTDCGGHEGDQPGEAVDAMIRPVGEMPVDWTALIAQQRRIDSELKTLSASAGDADRALAIEQASRAAGLLSQALANHEPEAASVAVADCGQAVDRLFASVRNPNLAGILGGLSILVMILWTAFAPKPLKVLPAALVAVLFAVIGAAVLQLPVVRVDVPDSLLASIQLPTLSQLQSANWMELTPQGVLVAVVASAETLLCAAAVDQMQSGPRTKFDQELISQGLGNSVCGLLGALPMTGVIVRSSANVQAGAKTRLSAILHGVWLLVIVVAMTAVLRMIPTSCLAAILVYTGYRLIDVSAIRELHGFGLGEVAIYAATVSVIVFEDLLMGVMVGMLLSAAKLIYTFSHLRINVRRSPVDPRITLHLDGAATFLRLPKLAATLEKIPPGSEIHIDLTDLDYIDHACLDLFRTWKVQHASQGGQVIIDWESMHSRFRRDRFNGNS